VRDGDNGRLFRAGDARHLASILCSLLSDRAAAERMARAARTDYLARFAPGVVALQMASFYRRVVARHRVAG
jgi:glycosyltransferase involved in cell wall biosynthesis